MNVTPYGPNALLARFAERVDERAFAAGVRLVRRLERAPLPGLREMVPGFTTLLLAFAPGAAAAAAELLRRLDLGEGMEEAVDGATLVIPARYDGPDLERVARHAGLSVAEVVARHAEADYRVHCLGFSPGFPYLGGLEPRLHTPRLASPRPRVPAGSVAIGGEHTGIYSIASPGGWNLIGATPERLFDPEAESLAATFLLRAGDRVRFVPIGQDEYEARVKALARTEAKNPEPSPSQAVLHINRAGLGLSMQDSGRPGLARFGVPPGGAMDPTAAAWANRLLDNPPSAPVLELCLQGQELTALRDIWIAVTGGDSPRSLGKPEWSAFRVSAGDRLSFPPGRSGVWSYLAIPGGFSAREFLGSVSGNPRAGIGALVKAGDVLAAAGPARSDWPDAMATRRVPWTDVPDPARPAVLRVLPGPQWELFSAEDRDRFLTADWVVGSQCDRVGYRLEGPPLHNGPDQIVSEPVLPGTIQVPANGQPIVTMPDGPTLGGYPKLAWIDSTDLSRMAQLRPGQTVRMRNSD